MAGRPGGLGGPECTFVDVLRGRAEAHPHRPALIFLRDGVADGWEVSYAELDAMARSFGAAFRSRMSGTAGGKVLILLPGGIEYVAAFFGALYAGAVAVTAYPPRRRRRGGGVERLRGIVENCAGQTIAVTTDEIRAQLPVLLADSDIDLTRWLSREECLGVQLEPREVVPPSPDELALLQYTSGATALPKGVMVTHRNLLHNQHILRGVLATSESSVFVSWLPLFHDMGLISMILHNLYVGGLCVFFAPGEFVAQPVRWLRAITEHRGTHTGAPNFAYDLCLWRVKDDDLSTLDLRSLEVAFNAAEPVRAATVEAFTSRFAPAGLRPQAVEAAYGLAEATLCVSGRSECRLPVIVAFDAGALERGRAEPFSGDGRARRLVACGSAITPDQEILVVDPATRVACPDRTVGEIWLRGTSVAQGYWRRPQETAETFGARLADGRGHFLRTGDFGFIYQSELFITGRLKDVIIVRGRSFHPVDLEATVGRSDGKLRASGCAVFSVDDGHGERIVVVQEARWSQVQAQTDQIFGAVRAALLEEHRVEASSILLVPPGTVPMTSSGKIRRAACRQAFLEGAIEVMARWDGPRGMGGNFPASVPVPRLTNTVPGGGR